MIVHSKFRTHYNAKVGKLYYKININIHVHISVERILQNHINAITSVDKYKQLYKCNLPTAVTPAKKSKRKQS